MTPDSLEDNLKSVLDCILTLPKPKANVDGPLQLMVSNVDYDDFKGRLGIGRIISGKMTPKMDIAVCHPNKEMKKERINEIFAFNNLGKVSVPEASAGDIVMFAGIPTFDIGDTIALTSSPVPLPPISVEEPTVRMSFSVNTTEFAGKEGERICSEILQMKRGQLSLLVSIKSCGLVFEDSHYRGTDFLSFVYTNRKIRDVKKPP